MEKNKNTSISEKMQAFNHTISMFICGFYDSISVYWIRKILFVTHPTTKKIHPLSL